MFVVTFTKDIPQGFAPVSVYTMSTNLEDCIQLITSRYMDNNYPELVLGEDSYECKRVVYKDYKSDLFIIDRYNVYDYILTIEEADHL